jgi:hypothetical protein
VATAREVIEAARAFWRATRKGIDAAKGEELTVSGMLGQIVGIDGSTLILRSGEFERRFALLELPVAVAAPFAHKHEPAPEWRYAVTCLYCFDEQWEGSSSHLAAVADGKRQALAGLVMMWRTLSAEMLVRQAKEAIEAGRDNEARSALRKLRTSYACVDAVKGDIAEVEETLAQKENPPETGPRLPPGPRMPADERAARLCPKCMGTGKIFVQKKRSSGAVTEFYTGTETCPLCHGRGRLPSKLPRPGP